MKARSPIAILSGGRSPNSGQLTSFHSRRAYKDPANWREDIATNVEGTQRHRSRASDSVDRIINFQTALCYGRPESSPIPVDHPLRPFTSYGISKVAGEHYLAMSGLPFVSLRLANVTGPRLAIGPIPTFYKRLQGGQACFCTTRNATFSICLISLQR